MTINLDNKTIEELKTIIVALVDENNHLKEIATKSEKIYEHWNKKERGFYRKDIDNDLLIERYKKGDTAYRIAKDMNIGHMTVISRLKKAGIYREGA